jgi:hypothetical protein
MHLTEVLPSTEALVNHEAGIPRRRREAQARKVARRWLRLVRPLAEELAAMERDDPAFDARLRVATWCKTWSRSDDR